MLSRIVTALLRRNDLHVRTTIILNENTSYKNGELTSCGTGAPRDMLLWLLLSLGKGCG